MTGADPHRDLGLAFAGGGNRAFYQYGLMERWWPRLAPRVAAIAACSAGACVVAMLLSGRRAAAREVFQRRTRGLARNLDWRNLLHGRRLAPHGEILRDVLVAIGSDGGLDRIRSCAMPVDVLASRFPEVLGPGLAAAVGIVGYQLEKALRPEMLHPRAGRALGFEPEVTDMRDCASPEELADLVLASSATPPFTPVGCFRTRRLLDGGLVDNVPAFVAEKRPGVRRTIVLLTRPYAPRVLGHRGRRLYLAPTGPTPIGRWDYTRPEALEDTVAMGEAEALVHGPALDAFLAAPVADS